MSSLDANKIKINLYRTHNFVRHYLQLGDTTIICYSDHITIRYFSYIFACVNANNCSVDLYNGDLQTTTVFFTQG